VASSALLKRPRIVTDGAAADQTEKASSMTIPLWVLLCIAGWTLVALVPSGDAGSYELRRESAGIRRGRSLRDEVAFLSRSRRRPNRRAGRTCERSPSPEIELFLAQLGWAINRLPPDATAYPPRKVAFMANVHTRWRDPAADATANGLGAIGVRRLHSIRHGGGYMNFIPEDDWDLVARAYLGNASRLASIKAEYDPHKLFRVNQNIRPTP
jgi:hypothetical protein